MRKKNWEHLQMDWLIWIQLLKSNVHLLLETPTSNSWRRNGCGELAQWRNGRWRNGCSEMATYNFELLSFSSHSLSSAGTYKERLTK
jgi:hypothetical protein